MFSTNVWILCDRYDISQRRLAKMCDVSYGTVVNILYNLHKPKQSTKRKIARGLGTTVERLETEDLTKAPYVKDVGRLRRNVAALLTRQCMPHKVFAEQLGISDRTLSCILRGIENPKDEMVNKFAEALGVTAKMLREAEFEAENPNADIANVGKNIRMLCKLTHVTQVKLAKGINVSQENISHIVNFRHQVRMKTVNDIANFWGIEDPYELLIFPNEKLYNQFYEKE